MADNPTTKAIATATDSSTASTSDNAAAGVAKPTPVVTALASFNGGIVSLTVDAAGNLFGATSSGGS